MSDIASLISVAASLATIITFGAGAAAWINSRQRAEARWRNQVVEVVNAHAAYLDQLASSQNRFQELIAELVQDSHTH